MKSYINYIKRQSHKIQDIHATIFATLATIIVVSIYLQIKYHFFYPEYTEVIYTKEKTISQQPSSDNKENYNKESYNKGNENKENYNKDFLKDFMKQNFTNKASNTIDLFINMINTTKVNFIDKI